MRLPRHVFTSRWNRSRILITMAITVVLLGSFPLYALANAQTSTNSNGFTVAVRTTPETAIPGEAVTISVTTTSARSATWSNVTVTVTNPSGQQVHRFNYSLILMRGSPRTNSSTFTLPANAQPGEYGVNVTMARQFNTTRVGTFQVNAAETPQSAPVEPTPVPATPTPEPVVPAPEPVAPTPEPTQVPQQPVEPTPEPVAPAPEPVAPVAEPVVQAGMTIQQMVNNAASGATVNVPAGVYNEQVHINKPLTLKAQPGAIIDGGDRPFWIVAAAHDVTIDGFEMRGGKNWEHWGGITNSHNNVHYDRLTVQNSTLHGASYAAIATKLGAGHRILNNTTYNNGALGIRIDSGSGHLIAGNRTYDNNLAGRYDSGWEAGGIKVSGNYGGASSIVIEHNHAYNNNGAGIWIDVDGNNVTIRNNNVHHNSRSGIIYELSFGGNIHDNSVWENGYGYAVWGWGAGILIQNSSNVSVSNNTVAWNADGISVISQNRGAERWNNVTGVSVFNNTVAIVHDGGWNTFAMGWLEDWNGVLVNNNSNNRGWGNSYWINTGDGADLRFRWGSDSYWRLNEFAASPGENNARYLTSTQKDQHLSGMGIPTTR